MEPLAADDPRQVGVFRLHARLGSGGMGRVYLGTSPAGRTVAVKIVHPELARDPDFMARFRREVQAAEAVSGAFTAPVVGAGPDDSPPWLATAFVAGPTLHELIMRAGPLPEAAVWRLAGGLIEALQAIHGRGLVHRDLKPGNILIAADGPRVIDFGISRALQSTVLTAVRTTMGTPEYMSPEQAAGRAIGPASDVFSLGSVIAFAATGTAPFAGGEALSVAYRIVHDEADLSGLRPELAGLVGWCLVKDPASRPSLAQLMGAVVAGSARFPAVAPGKFWPDPVAALVAGEASHLPGVATGLAANVLPTAQLPPDARAAPRRRGPGRLVYAAAGAGVGAAVLGAVLALAHGSGSPGTGHTPGTAASTGHAVAARTAAAGTSSSASSSASASASAAASPGTSPATASSSPPPAAVTVCTLPAVSCTASGASADMKVRPSEITVSADGSGYVKNLVWSMWGQPEAGAIGTLEVDNCTPDCAQGTYTGYPATVNLSDLTTYGTGLAAYATIQVASPADNNQEYVFQNGTVP